MLTKKEHITFWKNTAAKDWKAVNDLFNLKVNEIRKWLLKNL